MIDLQSEANLQFEAFQALSPLGAQQAPPIPGEPAPPPLQPGEVPNPMGDPSEPPPPIDDPDVVNPMPDVPSPMIA